MVSERTEAAPVGPSYAPGDGRVHYFCNFRLAARHTEAIVGMHAKGEFEVRLSPLATFAPDVQDGPPLGRMSIDKQFHGDLSGTTKGEMLTAGSVVRGSAAYVAVERFTGTVHGRQGSFALYHTGVMNRGDGVLTVVVAPDSATGDLAGLRGEMAIVIADGKHSYEFQYELP